MSDDADQRVKSVILRTTVMTAALGAALSPIPLADDLLLPSIYAVMAARIGHARGVRLTALPWRPIGIAVLKGLAVRAVVNMTTAFIPGVAAVTNATTAALLTQHLGRYTDTTTQGSTPPADDLPHSPGKPGSAPIPPGTPDA